MLSLKSVLNDSIADGIRAREFFIQKSIQSVKRKTGIEPAVSSLGIAIEGILLCWRERSRKFRILILV